MLKNFLLIFCVGAQFSLYGDMTLAEQLETKLWNDVKERKWADLESQIAPYFQLALYDGARTRSQYMSFVKALNLSNFTFGNFMVTEGAGIMVVTYDVAVSETISGTHFTSKAMRQSVWQKNGENWQWIAHAILLPIQR